MDHTKHTPLALHEMTSDHLIGAKIYDPEDAEVGAVSHLHGIPPNGQVVVDVGTFLGLGGKSVAIPLAVLTFMRDSAGTVHATTAWTKAQIKDLPMHAHA